MKRITKAKPQMLKLSFEDFEKNGDTLGTLNNNYDSVQCKLLVEQLNSLLNNEKYAMCTNINENQIIGQGAFGTIYLNDDKTIIKKSKTFNKVLEYMKDCDAISEKINSLLTTVLSIPETTEKIRTIVDGSSLKKHFNLPTSSKLCLCKDNTMAYNVNNIKKQIPVYEYEIPYVDGKDLYKFLMVGKYSYDDLMGMIVQLLYNL